MPSPLTKFVDREAAPRGDPRGNLFWGRLEHDGLPFRGHVPPAYSQDEFEANLVRVGDPHSRTFRTWIPEENEAYEHVLDMIVNGWAKCLHVARREPPDPATQFGLVVSIEWCQYFMEDSGRPATPGPTAGELANGSVHGFGHPFPRP